MKIINETKLNFDDVLIRPKRSALGSRSEVSLLRNFHFPNSSRTLECVPIFAANMDTTGSINMSHELSKYKCLTCLHKHYDTDTLTNFFINNNQQAQYTFYSTGISKKDLDKLDNVFGMLKHQHIQLPNICIDVANGYSENFVKAIKHIRNSYNDIIIMAGNVVTPEMTEELIIHGRVDIVKVGIGPGSVCTTRLKTGVGYPQLSAIMECADAAHGLNGHICADGGCRIPADICKAFGGNADFVMLGGMLAGTDCCEGEWQYELDKKISLKFYGMSSKEAMEKHHGGLADYRSSEGRCVNIPYKGTTAEVIKDILGGIRSACTYIGSDNIKNFSKKTTFIRVNDTHNRIFEK